MLLTQQDGPELAEYCRASLERLCHCIFSITMATQRAMETHLSSTDSPHLDGIQADHWFIADHLSTVHRSARNADEASRPENHRVAAHRDPELSTDNGVDLLHLMSVVRKVCARRIHVAGRTIAEPLQPDLERLLG